MDEISLATERIFRAALWLALTCLVVKLLTLDSWVFSDTRFYGNYFTGAGQSTLTFEPGDENVDFK